MSASPTLWKSRCCWMNCPSDSWFSCEGLCYNIGCSVVMKEGAYSWADVLWFSNSIVWFPVRLYFRLI